jgi:hypothetical protein
MSLSLIFADRANLIALLAIAANPMYRGIVIGVLIGRALLARHRDLITLAPRRQEA